jgi:hypothetical protein
MLSGVFIGLLSGISVATWVYSRTMNRTGNNTKSALIAGAMAGFFTFIVAVTVVAVIDSRLGS